MQTFWTTAGVIAVIAAYFAPTLIAARRRVTNQGSVFVVNLLTGFTVIGWIVALAMAVRTATLPPQDRMVKDGIGRWAGDIADGIKGPRG